MGYRRQVEIWIFNFEILLDTWSLRPAVLLREISSEIEDSGHMRLTGEAQCRILVLNLFRYENQVGGFVILDHKLAYHWAGLHCYRY